MCALTARGNERPHGAAGTHFRAKSPAAIYAKYISPPLVIAEGPTARAVLPNQVFYVQVLNGTTRTEPKGAPYHMLRGDYRPSRHGARPEPTAVTTPSVISEAQEPRGQIDL